METNRVSTLLGILRDHYNPREHGWMWIVVQPPGSERGVVQQVEGERPDNATVVGFLDELLPSLGPVEVAIAICRRGGRPEERDRELWRALRSRFDGEVRLLDFVVFNGDGLWSMREEDAGSNAVA